MSIPEQYDNDNDNDNDFEPEDQPREPRKLRDALERANAELKTLREQAERATAIEAENNLFRANLGNLTEAQQKAVLKTAGDMTTEALRSQAELLGFVQPPEPAVPAGELAAQERIAGAQQGGAVSPGDYDAEIAAAKDENEVLAVMAKHNRPVGTLE